MGKVDITGNKKLAARFQIESYPTLKFFRKGRAHDYTGKKHTAEQVVQWMEQNSVPLVTSVANLYELEQFKEAQGIVLVYFARNANREMDQRAFEALADDFDGVFFGLGQSQELRDSLGLGVDERIVLFTPYERKEVKFTDEITSE